MTNQQLRDSGVQPPEWQMPISTPSAGGKVGVTIDQQANKGELIHHFVSRCPEGEPCILPIRSSSSGGEGQQATAPDECVTMLTTATYSF